MSLVTHHQLAPKLKMSGTITPLLHIPSCREIVCHLIPSSERLILKEVFSPNYFRCIEQQEMNYTFLKQVGINQLGMFCFINRFYCGQNILFFLNLSWYANHSFKTISSIEHARDTAIDETQEEQCILN